MNVRKLRQDEHIRTRKLWEEVFTEDTPKFLDYYYSVKAKDNEIYVIEDGDEIVSMLHLNPYTMRIGDKLYQTHYIVAVATDERYRRHGFMSQLLNHAMQVMADRGEPFTFLMPAEEAIYKPFGFEFVYDQKREIVTGKCFEDVELEIHFGKEKDCQEIADFANELLQEYDIVSWRDEKYYKTLLSELASEDGGILILKRDSQIEGIFPYLFPQGEDGKVQIHEPLCHKKEDLQYMIYFLTGNEKTEVLCTGYGADESKPMIMAKVLNPDFAVDLKKAKVFLNEVV